MNLLLQPPKSKSTLTVSNHHAIDTHTRSSPVTELAVDTSVSSIPSPLPTPSPSSSTSSSSSPSALLAGLLNSRSNLNAYKTTPSISISSLHSLSSESISSSAQSVTSNSSTSIQPSKHTNQFISSFIDRLRCPADNIYVINSLPDAKELLDFYYSSSRNRLPKVDELFPYLHGLNGIKQKIFFNPELNSNQEINEKLASTLDLKDYDENRFNKNDVCPPTLNEHFHLSFISSKEVNQSSSGNALINSISIHDLLTPRDTDQEECFIEQISYQPFDFINKIDPKNMYELNNRNFKSQVKLTAPFANFCIYNQDNDYGTNLAAAKFISKSIDDKNSTQLIFILDLSASDVEGLGSYLEKNSEFYKSAILDNPMESPDGIDEIATFSCKLLKWEQNLIWNLNSMKWLHPKICLGTLIDFNRLTNVEGGVKNSPFKLYINCHQNAQFPELSQLNDILHSLSESESDGYDLDAIYLEFPCSGSLSISKITFEETLSFLNVLKIIQIYALKNHSTFVFCYDGFTGLSLLAMSIAYLFKLDPDNELTTENVLLDLLTDLTKDLRLYFFKNDLLFMKNLEKFIGWVHFENIYKSRYLNNFDEIDYTRSLDFHSKLDYRLILNLEHKSISKYSKYETRRLNASNVDWFDLNQDNNFPSRILNTLYLGSLKHASSITLLNAIQATRIVSLGEKPLWFKYLDDYLVFEHELSEEKVGNRKVIRPLYTYNYAKIYAIELNSGASSIVLSKIPNLKKIVYIYNLKDDGKDSLLPLLTEVPEYVKNEILIDTFKEDEKTLIHCRIGVSRSATLVIATLMKHYKWSLIQAYMFVRVKRFNIIIQPNLKIFYELFLYEEYLRGNKGSRTVCWEYLCNEIHKLNNHYLSNCS
ncbi:hypothetical protein CLIB1423_18S00474 [[Candida] railenensis]|uniref:Uncharacterized protein n=1 Tax=[Candida] railenensis TaxID=45579 RepID=A0A9P0W055_9ASCO|nr:hypothetical protein CLIB1423_18S00474 [[Candida] railenensis]